MGYQHQTWWALLELLRSGAQRPDATISLELFDDVAWDQHGAPTELLQLKHHRIGQRALTDASADVWATLKVWMDTAVPADPAGPTLALVSTQISREGSAVAALRDESRDDDYAIEGLERVALEAASGRTGQSRNQFLALGTIDRRTFISRIRVVDGAERIEDVAGLVRQHLTWALPTGHEDQFLALVWHWWDEQALAMLRGHQRGVDVGAAKAALASIRDRFTQVDLPTYVELADVDTDAVSAAHADFLFVQQMQWVAYPPRNLQRAVIDFYRASTQTVRWLDEDLIGAGELRRLQAELLDEWDGAFEWISAEISPDADEAIKQEAGRSLLRQLTQQTALSVRSRYNDAFFTRGQRHVLADSGHIGWHPDFVKRIDGSTAVQS
ncbi:ABC-three component system protein [Streptomyces sp. NPDC048415]|uniref:ABC-three component system protein n=1 Tax=Streptomyces sp. NPDC048415 TaxID=3154822 RepID=UPI00342AA462